MAVIQARQSVERGMFALQSYDTPKAVATVGKTAAIIERDASLNGRFSRDQARQVRTRFRYCQDPIEERAWRGLTRRVMFG